ncbi:MAG: hypothetical protein CM1200mP21_02150 [Candidatus Poseidoniales archaeon]|nr:MAG: hypothetical protein CM1200mP21_02150 [Candidatus Poseidoniales archaeon]
MTSLSREVHQEEGSNIGAHDNGAGVALVLEAAKGLAQFDHRRTIVVCFWSNEENGYDGVDRWIDNIPAGVTLSNYLNADAVGPTGLDTTP